MKTHRIAAALLTACALLTALNLRSATPHYPGNRPPLQPRPYLELPLGAVKARGWLLEMLRRQRDGMTSQMDRLYSEVMGPRNGWLGGDGDQWERGPYWIDGLLPLAWILDDEALKAKVRPWIEWTLASQRDDGFFGPATDYAPEKGLQRDNSSDWWPRMVMLKVLQQYHSATGDARVVDFMTRYFRYQLLTLPATPLGHWTSWAEFRACDNLQAVYWLYNLTGEAWLLELGELLHRQSVDFAHLFLKTDQMKRQATIHGVNLAQGLKEPVVYWQYAGDGELVRAVKKGLTDIRDYHGHPTGMYGADELLHGDCPTQGAELCSVVELMYSLEEMIRITGDLSMVDQLEKIAFNALPAQISDDFMSRQYFQQPNQVLITRGMRNFDINHGGTDLVFGLLTGYPCCTANLHQGWPKFARNLWYATPDGGLAALAYSPSEVAARVGEGVEVRIIEQTRYPMEGTVRFTVAIPDADNGAKVHFPLHLRIPSWSEGARITVNGRAFGSFEPATVAVVDREWTDGDRVELTLPMRISTSEWHERSVSVERGPLVYALKIDEHWKQRRFEDPRAGYGATYREVYPASKWNYGLTRKHCTHPDSLFRFVADAKKLDSDWYWNPGSAPVALQTSAKEILSWQLYNGSAGPQPYGRMHSSPLDACPDARITLIPYGCTTLRISEFPVW